MALLKALRRQRPGSRSTEDQPENQSGSPQENRMALLKTLLRQQPGSRSTEDQPGNQSDSPAGVRRAVPPNNLGIPLPGVPLQTGGATVERPAQELPVGEAKAEAPAVRPVMEKPPVEKETAEKSPGPSRNDDLLSLFTEEDGAENMDLHKLAMTLEEVDIHDLVEECRAVAKGLGLQRR